MTIRPIFAWYDLWIGAYWDRKSRRLYIIPIPTLGIVIDFGEKTMTPEQRLAELEERLRALADSQEAAGDFALVMQGSQSLADIRYETAKELRALLDLLNIEPPEDLTNGN